jgi:transcriptional regulator with XRE-family HTH domain
VHDAYMAANKRKKAVEQARTKFEPCYLRAWREHKGMSQHELSAKIGEYLAEHKIPVGHSYSIIGRIERGLTPYNQAILQAAAHVLGTSVKALLFVADPEQAHVLDMAEQLVRQVLPVNTPPPAIPGTKAKRA